MIKPDLAILKATIGLLEAMREEEASVANALYSETPGKKEEKDSAFLSSMVFIIDKRPKSSCKHCFGRGYDGYSNMFWYENAGKVYTNFPHKVTGNVTKLSYNRIHMCSCVGPYVPTTIDKVPDGRLYISVLGGNVQTKCHEQEVADKTKDQA